MPLIKTYTANEISKMEGHVELIRGVLAIQDYTSVEHNDIVSEIAFALRNYIKEHKGNCRVFQENVALFCNELDAEFESDFYLPDIMVVCNPDGKIANNGVHAVPDMVVEVTSPSTRANDYADKLYFYSRVKVQEYWIVDLQNHSVVKYVRENQYLPEYHLHPSKIPVAIFEGNLEIDFEGYL